MSARLSNKAFTPYAFLLPASLVLGVFVLLAMAQVAYYSLTRFTPFSTDGPEWVGLENYRRLLATDRFWRCLVNSLLYLLVTPAVIALSLGAALVVEAGVRWAKGLRLILFLPVVTPTIVAAIAFTAVLREDGGAFNTLLGALGLGKVQWLTQWPWVLVSSMMVTLWKGFGFYMMIFLAALLAVPRELKEAASIDGAGRLGVFRHVTLPAIWPVIALVFVISSIAALKVFEEVYITARGVPVESQTVVPLLYSEAFEKGDYGMASAVGVSLFLFILVLSILNLRLTARRGGEGAHA